MTEKATRFCAVRVQPEGSTAQLSKDIEKLEQRIEEEQRGYDIYLWALSLFILFCIFKKKNSKKSPAEITAEYKTALKTYKETKAALDRLLKFRSVWTPSFLSSSPSHFCFLFLFFLETREKSERAHAAMASVPQIDCASHEGLFQQLPHSQELFGPAALLPQRPPTRN